MAAKGKVRIRNREDGSYVAVIADEDTVTGFLLAGVGGLDSAKKPNFLVVDSSKHEFHFQPFNWNVIWCSLSLFSSSKKKKKKILWCQLDFSISHKDTSK